MSRSNPYVKKRRAASKTLLIFGEGFCERYFIEHLKSLYASNTGVSATVRCGTGGTPLEIVKSALRVPGSFDLILVMLDNDQPTSEMDLARREAQRNGVHLLENTPCLEALLLQILNPKVLYDQKSSPWCKMEFQTKYISEKNRSNKNENLRYFPKTLLDERRQTIENLDVIISCIEGKKT